MNSNSEKDREGPGHSTNDSERWEFDVDDVIVSQDAPDIAPTHFRVKRRLTDEDGGRFYHLAIRYPHTMSDDDSEAYGDELLNSGKIEGNYRYVDTDTEHSED